MILKLHVIPKSKTQSIEVQTDGTLKVRVRSAPEHGKANEELLELLASHLKIRRSDLEIVSGARGREKLVRLIKTPSLIKGIHGDEGSP
ncbi:MAG: DUF167 domain-containing protein [Desulfatiglandales bacterium]